MLKALSARIHQGYRTIELPQNLMDRSLGQPHWQPDLCPEGCSACLEACPTAAIQPGRTMDLGSCLFCGECTRACPEGAVTFTQDSALAVRQRKELVLSGSDLKLAEALGEQSLRLFGRSLRLRQVSAAGCNGCEAEVNALTNVIFDISRFGIDFVASPRHADGLLITGPVSQNMREALLKTYRAVPAPRIVVAVGACAISGGPYFDHPETNGGADGLVPVDLYVPGCPPHPLTILDGLLRLLGKLPGVSS